MGGGSDGYSFWPMVEVLPWQKAGSGHILDDVMLSVHFWYEAV